MWAGDSRARGGQALQEVLGPWTAVSCVWSSNTQSPGSHSLSIERWDDYPHPLCTHEKWGYSTWLWAPLNPNCGQTDVTSLRCPEDGEGWRSCPVRRGWGTRLACRHGAGGLTAAPSTWGRWLRRRGQASLSNVSNETRALISCYAAHSTFFFFFLISDRTALMIVWLVREFHFDSPKKKKPLYVDGRTGHLISPRREEHCLGRSRRHGF